MKMKGWDGTYAGFDPEGGGVGDGLCDALRVQRCATGECGECEERNDEVNHGREVDKCKKSRGVALSLVDRVKRLLQMRVRGCSEHCSIHENLSRNGN